MSEINIGPKIYEVGLIKDTKTQSIAHFYSIIERIHGKTVDEFIENISMDKFTELYTKFEEILKRIGGSMGYLLSDTKLINTMIDDRNPNDIKIYFIDFDPYFIIKANEVKFQQSSIINLNIQDIQDIFGTINYILFLCNTCNYISETDPNSNKIKEQIKEQMKLNNVKDVFQELYISNMVFTGICHTYRYNKLDFLEIVFLKYNEMKFSDMQTKINKFCGLNNIDKHHFVFYLNNTTNKPIICCPCILINKAIYFFDANYINNYKTTYTISYRDDQIIKFFSFYGFGLTYSNIEYIKIKPTLELLLKANNNNILGFCDITKQKYDKTLKIAIDDNVPSNESYVKIDDETLKTMNNVNVFRLDENGEYIPVVFIKYNDNATHYESSVNSDKLKPVSYTIKENDNETTVFENTFYKKQEGGRKRKSRKKQHKSRKNHRKNKTNTYRK